MRRAAAGVRLRSLRVALPHCRAVSEERLSIVRNISALTQTAKAQKLNLVRLVHLCCTTKAERSPSVATRNSSDVVYLLTSTLLSLMNGYHTSPHNYQKIKELGSFRMENMAAGTSIFRKPQLQANEAQTRHCVTECGWAEDGTFPTSPADIPG